MWFVIDGGNSSSARPRRRSNCPPTPRLLRGTAAVHAQESFMPHRLPPTLSAELRRARSAFTGVQFSLTPRCDIKLSWALPASAVSRAGRPPAPVQPGGTDPKGSCRTFYLGNTAVQATPASARPPPTKSQPPFAPKWHYGAYAFVRRRSLREPEGGRSHPLPRKHLRPTPAASLRPATARQARAPRRRSNCRRPRPRTLCRICSLAGLWAARLSCLVVRGAHSLAPHLRHKVVLGAPGQRGFCEPGRPPATVRLRMR